MVEDLKQTVDVRGLGEERRGDADSTDVFRTHFTMSEGSTVPARSYCNPLTIQSLGSCFTVGVLQVERHQRDIIGWLWFVRVQLYAVMRSETFI